MKWIGQVWAWLSGLVRGLLSQQPAGESQVENVEADPQIPAAYLERFKLIPLEDPGMMLGREKEGELLGKALKSWEAEGHPLLIMSEPGMGMTTFLNAYQTSLPEVFRLDDHQRILDRQQLRNTLGDLLHIDPGEDEVQPLVDQLDDTPRTVIFENVERLFLRKPYGFERLQDLFRLMALTRKKIFWVITVNRYATTFLDRVMDFTTNFRSRILLAPLPNDLIERMVLERNRGYTMIFLKPKSFSPLQTRQYRRAETQEEKQQFLRDLFMRRLHVYAQGNISRGLLFFRKSVRGIRNKIVYLRAADSKPDYEVDLENLMVLEAVLQHSSLSVSDLATVLRKPMHYALQRVTVLSEADLLVPENNLTGEPEYQINLDALYEVKEELRDKLNRKSY